MPNIGTLYVAHGLEQSRYLTETIMQSVATPAYRCEKN